MSGSKQWQIIGAMALGSSAIWRVGLPKNVNRQMSRVPSHVYLTH